MDCSGGLFYFIFGTFFRDFCDFGGGFGVVEGVEGVGFGLLGGVTGFRVRWMSYKGFWGDTAFWRIQLTHTDA